MQSKPRDLVQRAMRFEEVRPVPCWLFGLTESKGELATRLDAYYGSTAWRSELCEVAEGRHVGFIKTRLGNGLALDTFGVLLEEMNIAHVVEYPLKEPTLANFTWPDPETMVDWDAERRYFERYEGRFRLCGLAMGLFERSWFLRGFNNVMMDMVDHPDFYEELLDGIIDMQMKVMDRIVERIPIEGYYGGDDVSDQRGIMMGMKRWRKFFKPRMAKVIAHCHSLGKPYVMHACGNVLPLVDDLIEIGCDALESLQPEATDLEELKKHARGKLMLFGGMGVQATMFRGTPEEVKERTDWLVTELGKDGGYVIGPAKNLDKEPIENIVAFLEALRNQPMPDGA